ncbi:MAG: PQQ-dependent sugar dehydrogenase [Halioglobus sp.]|nr:PQQ-dependent sugar dehydrogenase [Halioglobus sp.]
MRKLIIGLFAILALLASIPLVLMATGTISSGSLRMILNVMTGMDGPTATAESAEGLQLPPGFTLELYAGDLPRARFLRFTPGGDLLLSRPHSGDIMLLRRDADGNGQPDAVVTLISGLKRPLGMDIAGGYLYIAESHQIGRVPFDSATGKLAGAYEPLVEGFTDDGNHGSKTLAFGPDGLLYLAQGSTCNVCVEEDERRATMMRFQPDGSGGTIIATGLRNSVGFDWAPWNGELYATDNGRDLLGDDFPPCELNLIEEGGFYGWPFFNGANLPDPDMGEDPLAGQREPTAPAHGFRAHNAPLGIAFIDNAGWPAGYQRTALVALHGSWNRSVPDGYKVVSLHWTDRGIEQRDFLTGFNRDGEISGRPVDVAQGPDGFIYISDDYAGAIYRVSPGESGADWSPPAAAPAASRLDAKPPAWLAGADLPALAKRGEQLYLYYECANCHESGENPKRLTGLADRLGYNAIIDVLKAPRSPMPLYPLSETELRELAVYLLHRHGASPPGAPAPPAAGGAP